jgi:hypothetical protein
VDFQQLGRWLDLYSRVALILQSKRAEPPATINLRQL